MGKQVRIRRTKQVVSMLVLSGGLALGGYGIASASSPSTSTSSTSAANAAVSPPVPGVAPWGHGPGAGGTVVSVTSTSLVVRGPNGSDRTYSLTSATTYHLGQSSSTLSAVKANDRVAIQTGSPTSTVATSVEIMQPRLMGTIQSITASSIVISDQQGFWQTIALSSGTKYEQGSTALSLASLKVGDAISASGTIASNHTTLDASNVVLILPSFVGTVTSVSGNVITITTLSGTTETVDVSSSTTYMNGRTSSSLSAVTKGAVIRVVGTVTSANTVNAMSIALGGPPQGPGSGMGGGPGGPGFGGGPGGNF